MPGISRFKQVAAEAKFNVTTECAYPGKPRPSSVLALIPTPPVANLGLHSAAASGDYGLVRYALTNGQPINSVLHGVLPIHVACSGGDEQVVNLLIDNGADVNAPRYVFSSERLYYLVFTICKFSHLYNHIKTAPTIHQRQEQGHLCTDRRNIRFHTASFRLRKRSR
jgi:hypothetical protein